MSQRGHAALVTVMLLLATASQAADKDREALKRVQQNFARVQAEKAALEREKRDISEKMDAATKDLDGVKGEVTASKRRVATLDKEVESLRKENAGLKEQLGSVSQNLADSSRQCAEAATLAQKNQKLAMTVNTNLKSTLAREEGERKTCQANNLKLRTIAHEILQRYQNKGPLQGLLQSEPFTGIKSVEIENLVQDYGDKIDGLGAGAP